MEYFHFRKSLFVPITQTEIFQVRKTLYSRQNLLKNKGYYFTERESFRKSSSAKKAGLLDSY